MKQAVVMYDQVVHVEWLWQRFNSNLAWCVIGALVSLTVRSSTHHTCHIRLTCIHAPRGTRRASSRLTARMSRDPRVTCAALTPDPVCTVPVCVQIRHQCRAALSPRLECQAEC